MSLFLGLFVSFFCVLVWTENFPGTGLPFTKWDDGKGPSLADQCQLEGKGSSWGEQKKKVKNPSSKEHFGSGELAGKQTLPLGSIHRQSQNWSHAQRDHAANSLELVSSVLWMYHAVYTELKPLNRSVGVCLCSPTHLEQEQLARNFLYEPGKGHYRLKNV